MSKTILGFLISGGVIVIGAIIFLSMMFSYQNQEVRLTNEYNAQLGKIEGVHDNMWKILQSKAGVTKEYAANFDSIYTHIISGRYDKSDGVLFNWIKEQNPEFSMELYKDLSVSIEVQRQKFLDSQIKIQDIVREQNNLLDMVPSSWFLGGRKRLSYEMISSSYSKSVMDTKLDDEKIDLFDKKENK